VYMNEKNLCLNLLSEDSFIQISQLLLDYFKYDKDSIFILSHLISQYKYLMNTNQLESTEYFYSTIEAIENKYYINDYSQRKAIKKLEECKFITTIKRGMPAKRYFKINFPDIARILQSSPKEFKRRDKNEYYLNINTSIEQGWEVYKNVIDNMDKHTALGMFYWKKIFDKKSTTKWEWDSKMFGIFHFWFIQGKKTGNIDYSYIKDYIDYIVKMGEIYSFTQESLLKKFTFWYKSQLRKAPESQLTDPMEVVKQIEENI
jgi:hypothetical protein